MSRIRYALLLVVVLIAAWIVKPEAQYSIRLTSGTTSPEGRVGASPGSMFLCNCNGTGTWYQKESGTGTTGWAIFTGGGGGPVAWDDIVFTGSDLADLETRSATSLSSGTLAVARLASGVTTVATTTSTGSQNNFAPGLAGNTLVRLNNGSALTITGFEGGVAGQVLTLKSIGAGNVFLAHDSGSSDADNKLINAVTSGVTPLAAGVGSAVYQYDGTTSVWRLIAHDQGAFITPAFSAGDYTGANSQTWTVESGDVTTNGYLVRGRILTMNVRILTTTVGGTPDPNLQIAFPNGYTGGQDVYMPAYTGQAAAATGLFGVFSGFNKLSILKDFAASNWAAGTNNTQVNGTVTAAIQ